MIVSVCLSKGALAMNRKKVIVKRLNAIQNFGGMDVFPIGPLAGPGATAADVLTDPDADSAQLCEPHTSDQSLAAAKEVDLDAL